MTLIVGIKCKDGVVLAADGAATYGAGLTLQPTIQQNTVKKLRILGTDMICGVSGPVAMGKAHWDSLEAEYRSNGNKWKLESRPKAKSKLESLLWKNAEPAWQRAGVCRPAAGQFAFSDCDHATAMACIVGGEPQLIQFTAQCAAEFMTDELPFVAIGSGQTKADPFLAFLRRVFWPNDLPDLNDGIFSALWTLGYVIHADTDINGPVQITVLKREGGQWVACELSGNELQEHTEYIQEVEARMRKPVLTNESVPTPPVTAREPGS